MLKHIIVPLDGSAGAEQAVPVAARLARCMDARVVLVRVVETAGTEEVYLEPGLVRSSALAAQQAAQYLDDVARRIRAAGILVEVVVERGAAVARILAAVERYDAPLVVMRSRGRTGRIRMGLGSVARQIIGGTRAPVFVLPYGRRALPPHARYERLPQSPLRIVVPLDGSALAEEAHASARSLLEALALPGKGELHLMQVVPVFASDAHEQRAEAACYLRDVAERVRAELRPDAGQTVSWSVVYQSETPHAVVQVGLHGIERDGPGFDVVVMTTHGQGGLLRSIVGGVTEQALYLTQLPIMVVRPRAAAPAPRERLDCATLGERISHPALDGVWEQLPRGYEPQPLTEHWKTPIG